VDGSGPHFENAAYRELALVVWCRPHSFSPRAAPTSSKRWRIWCCGEGSLRFSPWNIFQPSWLIGHPPFWQRSMPVAKYS